MSISHDNPRPHRAPPWKWGAFSLGWQAFFAAALALAVLLLMHALAPGATHHAIMTAYVAFHEMFHALGAIIQNGTVYDISITSSHSGAVKTTSADPVLTAAAGIVGPAWLAAILVFLATTRTALSFALALMALCLFFAGVFAADDTPTKWALYGAAAIGALGLSPMGPFLKSTALHIYGFSMCWGVLSSLGYLKETYINNDPDLPSDVQIIANALESTHTTEVQRVLILAMLLGAALAIIAITNWFARSHK